MSGHPNVPKRIDRYGSLKLKPSADGARRRRGLWIKLKTRRDEAKEKMKKGERRRLRLKAKDGFDFVCKMSQRGMVAKR